MTCRRFNLVHCSLLSALLVVGCSKKEPEPIRLMTFKQLEKNVLIDFKFPETVFAADSGRFFSFPVQGDEIISTDDDIMILGGSLPDTISIRNESFLRYLNDQLYEIRIDTSKEVLPWLQHVESRDISHLQFLSFNTPIQESHKIYLQKIAQVNPHIDIMLGYDSAELQDQDLQWLGKYFKPRRLITGGTTNGLASLSDFTNLEFLVLVLSESDTSIALPPIPSLRALHLVYEHNFTKIPISLFNQNLQLEKLTVMGGKPPARGLPPWHILRHLNGMNLLVDSLPPYNLVMYHPELRSLGLRRISNLDSVKGLTSLTWLSAGESVGAPQEEPDLEQIVISFPSLKLLGLYNIDTIRDFSSLNKLSQLKYLIISHQMGLDTTLYGVKGLKFLSVPDSYLKDTTRANALKRALPSTIISPNSGVCMGAGWLLMLLPMAGIFLLLGRYWSLTPLRKNGS